MNQYFKCIFTIPLLLKLPSLIHIQHPYVIFVLAADGCSGNVELNATETPQYLTRPNFPDIYATLVFLMQKHYIKRMHVNIIFQFWMNVKNRKQKKEN